MNLTLLDDCPIITSEQFAREIISQSILNSSHSLSESQWLISQGFTQSDRENINKIIKDSSRKISKRLLNKFDLRLIGYRYVHKGTMYSLASLIEKVFKKDYPTYTELCRSCGLDNRATYEKIIKLEYPTTKHRMSMVVCRAKDVTPVPIYSY